MKAFLLPIVMAIVLACTFTVSAHSPDFPNDNGTLDEAYVVNDISKSWVLYGEADGIGYFTLPADEGDRVYVRLIVPGEVEETSLRLTLLAPGLPSNGVPDGVDLPEGYGALAPGSELGDAEYEGFTPSALRTVAEVDLEAVEAGDHYAVVTGEGRFGLVIGYVESFTPLEFVSVPYEVVLIHLWEGQSLAFILAPLVIVVVAVMTIVPRRLWKGAPRTSNALALGAGAFFLGSATMLAVQIAVATSIAGADPGMIITLAFMFISIALGLKAISLSAREVDNRWRATMALLSLLGLLLWAGLYIGPVLALLAVVASIRDGDHHPLLAEGAGEPVDDYQQDA